MSGLCVQLGSTPPQALPTPSPHVRGSGSKRAGGAAVLAPPDAGAQLVGSFKGSMPRSYSQEAGGYSLGRSLGRPRTTSSEGALVGAGAASLGAAGAAASAAAARPLQSTKSIPKSAAFVKIEGFATEAAPSRSPAPSPPPSPQQPRALPSLLSRQLSTDRLPVLGSPTTAGLLAADDPMAGLAARLEQTVRLAPVPRPAPLRPARQTVPDNLLQQLQDKHPVFREAVCVRAFSIARFAHDGKYRASGEPAFLHCAEVAAILAGLGAGEGTVAAALLHDVLDKTLLVEAQLRPMLQDDGVAELVKQVAHLGDVSSSYRACPATSPEGQAALASQLVGMLVAMGCNHALLVKLADRLHDMRTLAALPAAKRNRLAQETLDVWAPLANRLGVWSLKAQLEDLAFKQLYPAQYAELRGRLEQVQSADVLVGLVDRLRGEMQRQGISYHDLSGRPKHLWGIWKKMRAKGYTLSRVSDVRGLRIIVDTKADCYQALRAVEHLWRPVEGTFKNYILQPKANGYQSLHLVVRGDDGHDIEVQIRTAKMHFFAEYGSEAAHWQYKERGYGGSTAGAGAAAAAAAGAGGATSSVDDDVPTAAGATAGGARAGAAREANWAKFALSQQLADQKYRPSGSPTQDTSLASLVAAALPAGAHGSCGAGSSGEEEEAPAGSPPRDERFAAYLARSGQQLAPPPAERVVVAVVCQGGLSIEELPAGTTVQGLVAQRAPGLGPSQLLVNKQEEALSTQLRTGDVVALYPDPAAPAAPLAPRPARVPLAVGASVAAKPPPGMPTQQSNVVPLGALRRATQASAV